MNDLQLSDLPEIGDRKAILAFASSSRGYSCWGSFHACAEAARAKSRKSLVDLRTELFFSYRTSNHLGTDDYIGRYAKLYPYFVAMLEAEESSDADD